ncbi:hypothetical protein ES703_55681 [subsurface metagenome]
MKAGQTGYELKRLKRLSRQDLIKELAELKGLNSNGDLEEKPPVEEEEEAAAVLRPKGRKRRRNAVVKVKGPWLYDRDGKVVEGRPGPVASITLGRSK